MVTTLTLVLETLTGNGLTTVPDYSLFELRQHRWAWDRVVRSSHLTNCAYLSACNFDLFVKDGVVLREEQVGNYPAPNDPRVPDFNPRGCQKGVCYAQRMYDPTRIKYPVKRVGERGQCRWKRLSWDEALTEVADVLIDTLITDGPDAIVQGGGLRILIRTSEATAVSAFLNALGTPHGNPTGEVGDDYEGAALTFGKITISDSADNWFHADTLLIWGGNPAYTNLTNFHFIAEARYKGTRVITISPDYSPSAIHADLWVPVKIGTDAALALSMCQVIISERLFKAEFVREQTDLPLLVVEATGSFLREKDLKRGGRDDIFYCYDEVTHRVVEAPRKSLALNGIVPALEGTFQVNSLQGPMLVKPVMEALRQHLDRHYAPGSASVVTGVPVRQIRELAYEVATAGGVVFIPTMNWGKFYHGGLIQRATILVFALCGHLGRKGASYNAFPMLGLDTAVGGTEVRGDQVMLSASGTDPRFAQWREDGYTDEMILYEYARESFAQGKIIPTSLMYYLHGGLLDLSKQHNSWDPYLKRPLGEYVDEAFAKGWQFPAPARGVQPVVLFAHGGNFVRRTRGTDVVLQNLLPKLRLLVCIDWRWNSTALHSDIVLPVCGWYERTSSLVAGFPQIPFFQVLNQATEPLSESKGEWALFVALGRKVEERAKERGITGYVDGSGMERRFDGLAEKITFGGLYTEDDEQGVARDMYLNANNVEQMDWEELKERGIAHYTGLGKGIRSIGNACDIVPGDPLVPLTWHTDKKEPYPTLTRRIQFLIDHELFQELGEDLPVHKDCPEAGGSYPLQLVGGHARWSIHSDWVDDSVLLQLQRGEPVMFMSVEDSRSRAIADGDLVELFNDVASLRIQAAVSPAVRPGQILIYHAWENYQFPGWQHFKSVMPTPLNPIELAGGRSHVRPITAANYPGFSDRDTRVEARRVNGFDVRQENRGA